MISESSAHLLYIFIVLVPGLVTRKSPFIILSGRQVVGQVKKVGKSRNFPLKVGKSRNISTKK